jgi:endonuclease/exonuclease/phosphatase family metal-dependent hydrolase
MPKIVFWNIQRSGGKVRKGNEGTDNLNIVLESIAASHQPDLIILCEGQRAAGRSLEHSNRLPTNYSLVRTTGDYKKETTLQYVVMNRAGTSVTHADLHCGDGQPRPVQFLRFQTNGYHYVVAAMHAASVSASATKQMEQTNEVFRFAQQSTAYRDLHVIIGDMNMNAQTGGGQFHSIFSKQDAEFQKYFKMTAPTDNTHSGRGGGYDKVLDWAWVRNSITGPSISAIQFKATNDFDKMEMDDDEADEDWKPQDNPGIKSDHLPIMLSW